jgi:hypothetical protein
MKGRRRATQWFDCFLNMKVTCSSLTTSVFGLVKTVEVEIGVGEEQTAITTACSGLAGE